MSSAMCGVPAASGESFLPHAVDRRTRFQLFCFSVSSEEASLLYMRGGSDSSCPC